MNMNLVSVDGVAIKSAQKWIKRCLSCRKFMKVYSVIVNFLT